MHTEETVTKKDREGEERWTKEGRLLCRAHSRTGQPCKMPAIHGTTVCGFHGGKAPQVQRKARLRLIELIDPAIATLAREMAQADKSSDKQRAANSILDRAGIPRSQVQVDGEVARDVLIERILGSLTENGPTTPQDDDSTLDTESAATDE